MFLASFCNSYKAIQMNPLYFFLEAILQRPWSRGKQPAPRLRLPHAQAFLGILLISGQLAGGC